MIFNAPFPKTLKIIWIAACFLGCLFFASCKYQPPSVQPGGADVRKLADSIPPAWLEEPVIILADTVAVDFLKTGMGNTVQMRECTWYYVNRRNPEILSRIVINEFETFESTPVIEASIIYPDGRRSSIPPYQISRVRGGDASSFTTNKLVNSFLVPQYQQGMFIRLCVTRTYKRPSFYSAVYMRESFPVVRKQIVLSWPRTCTIRHMLANNEGLVLTESRSDGERTASMRINGKNIEKLADEQGPRYPEQWYAALHFSLPPDSSVSLSWQQLGDYYLEMITSSAASSPEVVKMAAGISGREQKDLVDRAFRALRKNIRYHAREENEYAIIPRTATEVIEKGYGDCKEMCVLLKALLAEKGISSNLTLVSTPGWFQAIDSIPALSAFNHLILYIPDFEGQPLFLDPTILYSHSRNSYYSCLNQRAFILEQGRSRFVTVSSRAGEGINRVETRSTIERTANNDAWQIKGRIVFRDRAAFIFYPFVKDLKTEENAEGLAALLGSSFNLETQTVALETASSDSIAVHYTAGANRNYLPMGRGGFVIETPSLFGGPTRFTTQRHEGPRVYEDIEQQDEWRLPVEFTELESRNLTHPVATGVWSQKGAAVSRLFTMKRSCIPVDDTSTVRDFYRTKDAFFKATIWRK